MRRALRAALFATLLCALALAAGPAFGQDAATTPGAGDPAAAGAGGATTGAPDAAATPEAAGTTPAPQTGAPAPEGTATPGTTPAPTPAPQTSTQTVTEVAAPPAASDEDGPSPLVVGLIVLVVLGLLVLLGWGVVRATAWEPAWLPRLRHSVGEAGYRSGATWDEFRDWLRPRRSR